MKVKNETRRKTNRKNLLKSDQKNWYLFRKRKNKIVQKFDFFGQRKNPQSIFYDVRVQRHFYNKIIRFSDDMSKTLLLTQAAVKQLNYHEFRKK